MTSGPLKRTSMKRRILFRLKWLRIFPNAASTLSEGFRQFYRDNGFFLSSGIAFNLLINLIPFLMLLIWIVGMFLYNQEQVLTQIQYHLRNVAPTLDPQIMKELFEIIQSRNTLGILGFVGLFWVSTWVFSSLRIALNIVFRATKSRGTLRGMATDVIMILIIGILLMMSLGLTSVVTFLQKSASWLPSEIGRAIPFYIGAASQWLLKYAAPFLFTYLTVLLIYRIIPNRKISFTCILHAALFTALLWEAAKHVFNWYILHFATYSVVYGSLSTLVIFILWIYYSAAVLLIGGEIADLLMSKQSHRR